MPSFVSLEPAPGEYLPNKRLDVELTEASTYIDVKGVGQLNLSSDDTTPANRLVSFTPGDLEGQKLTITFNSGSGTTCNLSTISAAYIRVLENWQPKQYDTISFVWSDGLWQETSRGPVGGTMGTQDLEWVDVPAGSSKWTSTCQVAKFAGGAMAVMKGNMESTAAANADPMGTFPSGYQGSFSMQVTANIGGSITQCDIGTSAGIFGTTPVFNAGDKVWMNITYPLFYNS